MVNSLAMASSASASNTPGRTINPCSSRVTVNVRSRPLTTRYEIIDYPSTDFLLKCVNDLNFRPLDETESTLPDEVLDMNEMEGQVVVALEKTFAFDAVFDANSCQVR